MSFFDVMSLVGAFVVIIAALALLYYVSRWYVRRTGGAGGGKYVKIIDRTPLAQGSSVCIAKIGGRYYLLGVSDKAVTMLGDLPDFHEHAENAGQAGASFSQIMRGAMGNRMDDGERK
jgi:flagellar biosynthetic protein FliO